MMIETGQASAIALLYFWVMWSLVSGFIAVSKGRDGLLYFVISLVMSPLIGLPLIIGLTDRSKR
jgi:hypothetical protein